MPAGSLRLGRGRRRATSPTVEASADDASVASGGRALPADAPLGRPPARRPLRRRADERPARRATTSSTCSSRSPITRRSRCSRRRSAATPNGTGVALEQLLAVSSRSISEAERRRDPARRSATRCRDALGFQNVLASLRDAASGLLECAPRSAGASTRSSCAGTVYFDDVERCSIPNSRSRAATCCRATEAEHRLARRSDRPIVRLRAQRQRPVGVEPPLAARAAARGERRGDRHALGRRARRPAAAVAARSCRRCASSRTRPPPRCSRRSTSNELRFLADHDPLTRLLNRRAFVDRLDGEVARAVRYGRSFGLVLCDLDDFKELNDRYGHPAGDEALQSFARTLQARAAQGRRRVPDRRRRVRAAARRGDARTTRARSSSGSPSERRRRRRRASASRRARSTPATRRRSSAWPTPRCTRRSATAPACSSWPSADRGRASATLAGAEVRPLRARLGRARDLGEGAERPLGLARLLDRRRLARREATTAPASRTSSSTSCSRGRARTTRSRSPRRSTRWARS